MALPTAIAPVANWILRTTPLRDARARAGTSSDSYRRAVDQVKMLVEVARRVAEPVEALPRGSRPAVLLSLYRDAVYWALVAEQARRGGSGVAADLGSLWSESEPAFLQKAAGDEGRLTAVRTALLDRPTAASLSATEDDVTGARLFVENLLWELDAPSRTVERLQVQRWTRVVAIVVVLAGAAFGIRSATRGPNLVAARVFKTSTSLPECTAPNRCADVFFHTQQQSEPWIDFDLGATKSVGHVEVRNRTDCCGDRAVPLIVEVSVDGKTWKQVARRETEFTDWSTNFSKEKARHVRLRVPRSTTLHLEDVVVR